MNDKEINKIDKDQKKGREFYPNISNIASSHECTGAIPTPPQNEDEEDSYKELTSMQTPNVKNKQKTEKNKNDLHREKSL